MGDIVGKRSLLHSSFSQNAFQGSLQLGEASKTQVKVSGHGWIRTLSIDEISDLTKLKAFNHFPKKLLFLCVCSTSLLETLWGKKKLLVSVFYPFEELSTIFCKISKLLSANSFSLEESKQMCEYSVSKAFIKYKYDFQSEKLKFVLERVENTVQIRNGTEFTQKCFDIVSLVSMDCFLIVNIIIFQVSREYLL